MMTMLLTSCLSLGTQSNDVTVVKPVFPTPDTCVVNSIMVAHEVLIPKDCSSEVKSWMADLGRLKMKLEN